MDGSSLAPTLPLSAPEDRHVVSFNDVYSPSRAHLNSPESPEVASPKLSSNAPNASTKRSALPQSHIPMELLLSLKRQTATEATQAEETKTKLPPVKGAQVRFYAISWTANRARFGVLP